MTSRELALKGLSQTSDPPRGLLSAILEHVVYPFRRGVPTPFQPATGFFTDTTVCIGCKACEVACKQWNLIDADGFHWSGNSFDNTGELSANSWRHVKFIEQFPREDAAWPPVQEDPGPWDPESLERLLNEPKEGRWPMMSDVCKHCGTAPCHQACPTGAIVRTEFDNVFIQADICNGCSSCVAACPFGVITRSGGDGHSHKCTLCYDRQRDGLVPACAKACPTQSIQFGPVEELRERAHRRLAELRRRGLTNAYLYGDTPSPNYSDLHSFYLLVEPTSQYGLPEEPYNPGLHMAGDYVRALISILTAMAALLAVLLVMGN
jgi:formate dehydrogenase iron-sulfur subunit